MRMPPVPAHPYDRRSSSITPGLRNGYYFGAFEANLPLSRSETAAVGRDHEIVDASQAGDRVEVQPQRS